MQCSSKLRCLRKRFTLGGLHKELRKSSKTCAVITNLGGTMMADAIAYYAKREFGNHSDSYVANVKHGGNE